MKYNKANLALLGGILLGFITLGILFASLSGGSDDKTTVFIVFATATSLCAALVALTDRKGKQSGIECQKS
jgi:hypothetical protein